MAPSSFETLLVQADTSARQGQWPAALSALEQAARLQPEHAGALTGVGTCLLQLQRPSEALGYFQTVARLEPSTAEAHNNLGVAYTVLGQPAQAEGAYRQALACDQHHVSAWKNLAVLCVQQGRFAEGVPILASLVKAHPEDLEALLLMADVYEQGDEPDSARVLYERVLALQPDQPTAQAALARLAPAPAAHRIARPEHAKKLAALKSLKPAAPAAPAAPTAPAAEPATAARPAAIVFYGTGEFVDGVRLAGPGRALSALGHRVKVTRTPEASDADDYDLQVFARPHATAEMVAALERAVTAGRRYVVDLDEDYRALPPDHPAYATAGPGNPAGLKLLDAAIQRAAALVVATPVLAERYGSLAKRTLVIPDGWEAGNPLWTKAAPARATLNVGWVSTSGQRDDLNLIRNELVRLARECPQVQLVVAGDYQAMSAFAALPEKRRLYLPLGAFDDYPFVLAQFDILVVPRRDSAFNQARSDRPLMEAGVRGLPWVASALPAFQSWAAAGRLAQTPSDWFTALKELVDDAGQRAALGAAGRQHAAQRESAYLAELWRTL